MTPAWVWGFESKGVTQLQAARDRAAEEQCDALRQRGICPWPMEGYEDSDEWLTRAGLILTTQEARILAGLP